MWPAQVQAAEEVNEVAGLSMRTAVLAMLAVATAWLCLGHVHAAPAESTPWWNPVYRYRLNLDLPRAMEDASSTQSIRFDTQWGFPTAT